MTGRKKHMGLRARLFIANTAILLVLGLLVTVFVRTELAVRWTRELRRSWFALATHLADDVTDVILTRDYLKLRSIVAEHIEELPEEIYIFVMDTDGNVVAHSFAAGLPRELKRLGVEGGVERSATEVVLAGERILDVGTPVLEGAAGVIHVGFSEHQLHSDIARLIRLVVVTVLAAVGLQIGLSLLLSARITRPILSLHSLAEQVRRMGSGGATVPLDVTGSSEVADVASAYNTMREQISSYQQQLRSLASQLSLAEEKERRVLAGLLHDHVGQIMLAVKLKLSSLAAEAGDQEQRDGILEARELVGKVIEDTRSLILEISPPVLSELGLNAALESLCGEMRDRYGLTVSCDTDNSSTPLGEDIGILLFQCVRELLVNVVKHAATSTCALVTTSAQGRFRVTVRDSGAGFDANRALDRRDQLRGYGLFSIRERLSHFDGVVSITSEPGKGTTVTLEVPLAR